MIFIIFHDRSKKKSQQNFNLFFIRGFFLTKKIKNISPQIKKCVSSLSIWVLRLEKFHFLHKWNNSRESFTE